ncbi:MAG TPA: oligosaccharide flippase family protein [Thermoplasmata archaeon]|nr:oligosaccharide flippase family protein [Thermoplasmata archaeon]
MGGTEPSAAPPEPTSTLPTPARGIGISSTGVFLISIFIQFIGYISTFFLARDVGVSLIGQDTLGEIQWYLFIASTVNGLGDLRLGAAFIFFVSRGKPAERLAGTYFTIRLGLLAVAAAILFGLAAPVARTSGMTELEVYAAFLSLTFVWSIPILYNQLWVAKGDSVRAQFPTLIESIVRTSLLVVVALALAPLWAGRGAGTIPVVHFTLVEIMLAYVAGALASALFAARSVTRHTGRPVGREAIVMFRYAAPLMGALVLLYFATNVPQIIVNAALGFQQFNIFNASNSFRVLVLQIPAAITVPLFPFLAALHVRRKYEEIRQKLWQSLRFTAMVIVPAVIALSVYRINFLNVFYRGNYTTADSIAIGPFFVSGDLTLMILALSAVPLALSQVIGTALSAIGYQKLELYLTSLQVAVLFGFSFLLIPSGPNTAFFLGVFGLQGLFAASIAILLSSVAAFGLNTYFMERLLAVRIRWRSIGLIFGSSVASFVAISQFNRFIPVDRWYVLLAAVAIGFAAYYLVMAFTGELSREDVLQLSGMLGLPARLARLLARICWREATPVVAPAPDGAARGLKPLKGEEDLEPPAGGRPPS